MNILDLAKEINLNPKRVANTHGGEYKTSCPGCNEGCDRFCIWPKEGINGKYWCRICGRSGDSIQFCRDFLGLTYLEACRKLNQQPNQKSITKKVCPIKNKNYSPHILPEISKEWQLAALNFVNKSAKDLVGNQDAIYFLQKRGFSEQTINTFKLGWNANTLFAKRTSWGLPGAFKEDGQERKQWLPKGIVIPTFENGFPIKLKIRRCEWHSKDTMPKYVEISGGLQKPSLYGDSSKPIIIVESELDAILIQQFASDLCCCLALGGVGKKPDKQTDDLLRKSQQILLSLDYDEAGKKEYAFWMRNYSNIHPWPASKGKSPGDSFSLYKVDIKKWVYDGLKLKIAVNFIN